MDREARYVIVQMLPVLPSGPPPKPMVYAADATSSFWQSPEVLTVGIGHLVLLERLWVQSRVFKIRNAPTKVASTDAKEGFPSMTSSKVAAGND